MKTVRGNTVTLRFSPAALPALSVAMQTAPSTDTLKTKAAFEMTWNAVLEKAGETVRAFLPHMSHVIKGWLGLSTVTLSFAPKEEPHKAGPH